FVLQLTANDSLAVSSNRVTIYVNQPPIVAAGPDQSISFGQTVTLDGAVSDDGLPSATLSSSWSLVSGPGQVVIADAHSTSTTSNFSAAGTYVFRLTATDGALNNFDEATVTVIPVNHPPFVNVGPKQVVTLPAAAAL